MNEFIEQFLIEARELVEQATHDLLALEADPKQAKRLDGAFRALHTLKGAAGIIEFPAMSRALHAGEDALETVRRGARPVSAKLIGDCLNALDQVAQWLDRIEVSGEALSDAEAEADAVIARFDAAEAPRSEPPRPPSPAGEPLAIEERVLQAQIQMLLAAGPEGLRGRLMSAALVAERALIRGGRSASLVHQARDQALAAADAGILIAALRPPGADPSPPEPTPQRVAPEPAREAGVRALRVEVSRIDALVRLTGEITVVKTAIGDLAQTAEAGGEAPRILKRLREQHAQFDRLVGELQHLVLGIRVLPLRQVFQQFPRLVRELGVQLGKPIRLITEGEDTEADKAIVESLYEPLLHILRNAVDHGVEDADGRRRAGKPPIGVLTLRAFRQGEHVVIEVEDDGRGLDVDRVRAAAVEKGLVSRQAIGEMTEAAILDLIFAPGFSTARTVSDLSGRGVGMDAVRTAVERMGGRAVLESRPGLGASVRLVLPFTLMLTRVMTVKAGGQLFGVPFDAVAETLRVPRTQLVRIGAARALIVRRRTVPVVALADSLGGGFEGEPPGPEAILVLAEVSGQAVALEVDAIGEPMEVMLKPIGGLAAALPGVSGAALLGDGQVLLVLDLPDLITG